MLAFISIHIHSKHDHEIVVITEVIIRKLTVDFFLLKSFIF